MKGIKKLQRFAFVAHSIKKNKQENKIQCSGCREEKHAWELHYDAAVDGLLCRICSCIYANFEQPQIEMEDN